MRKEILGFGIILALGSCSLLSSKDQDKPAQFIAPATIQEDSLSYKYTVTEIPGSKIKDSAGDEMNAAGQWVVLNFAVTNTSEDKQEIYESVIELQETLLITSDAQEWNYPTEIYDYGIRTVQSGQSYNLKLAYDVPADVKPEKLIYRFYDEDFNRTDFEVNVQVKQ
ncbi:MAG: DUF4352 domain-containing protein [Prochlorothrix sp.]